MSKHEVKTAIYSKAPDMMLDKMAVLSDILLKHKAKGGNPDSLKFYEEILGTMKFAYAYMMDVAYVYEHNQVLNSENDFLKKWAGELNRRLNDYETINRLKTTGNFEETCQIVDQYIANLPKKISE
jgi:hypothetical protein